LMRSPIESFLLENRPVRALRARLHAVSVSMFLRPQEVRGYRRL
jgi:hypothetical protein